jgi:hypothetical protein
MLLIKYFFLCVVASLHEFGFTPFLKRTRNNGDRSERIDAVME